MNKLRQVWANIRLSFWFLPFLIVLSSVIYAVALIETDSVWGDRWLSRWPWIFGVGAEAARDMLSTLAGSMMSVMGITFSMTLLALTLASSQYTSRILWNFMRNRVTQVTLGTFAGIFVYCLIVMHAIRTGDMTFVPSLAVFFAFIMALVGIAALIFFIHHIAASIQASSIIASVAEETNASIERLLPAALDSTPDEHAGVDRALESLDERTWYPVPAKVSGYIQRVDTAALLSIARENRSILRMEHGVGAFVVRNTALVSLALTFPPEQKSVIAINSAYSIGRHRSVEQDPAFGIRQVVDIAIKALSPGINDTSTAIMCIDYLTSIIARLAGKQFPSAQLYEEETLRIEAIVISFEGLLAQAFDQIRRSAGANVAIFSRLITGLDTIGSLAIRRSHIRALDEQLEFLVEVVGRRVETSHDRGRLEEQILKVRKTLENRSISNAEEAQGAAL
jgi:uncharacterized membrane protein